MKKEIAAVWTCLWSVVLQEKFCGYWYPDNPSKVQALRYIWLNRLQREDPELLAENTLWVDPGEVCCRYGEKDHAFTVASFFGDEDVNKIYHSVCHSMVPLVVSLYGSSPSVTLWLSLYGSSPSIIWWHPLQCYNNNTFYCVHILLVLAILLSSFRP
uniref:Anti-proliferative protein domain-containing protein n=1 Tax=Hucho hucho TaxID=62062 RepID=A0A4W5L9U4_9TELE